MKRKLALLGAVASLATAAVLLAMAGSSAAATGVLYDQNDNGFANAYVSWTGYGNALADDFVVPSSVATWEITQVFTAGADNADLTSVTVTIYSDSSDSPGTQLYTVDVPAGSFTDTPDPTFSGFGYTGGDLTIPIDATLTPGHYWLSVVGDGPDTYYWQIRSVVSNDPAMTYGLCGNVWDDMAPCFDISGDPSPADLAFTLTGTSTTYAGTPGTPNCVGKTVSALSNEYDDLSAAATALGYDSVKAMQTAIKHYCRT